MNDNKDALTNLIEIISVLNKKIVDLYGLDLEIEDFINKFNSIDEYRVSSRVLVKKLNIGGYKYDKERRNWFNIKR